MSQDQVLKILERKDELSCQELAKELDLNFRAVLRSLTQMLKRGEVERIFKTKEEVEAEGKHYNGRAYKWKIIKVMKIQI